MGKSKEASKKSSKGDSGTPAGAGAGSGTGKVKGAQSLKINHMLFAKQSNMLGAIERLNAGEDFKAVATKSEDKVALGWKTKTDVVEPFWTAAVALEASTTAAPKWAQVKTEFGYHIVMVEARK